MLGNRAVMASSMFMMIIWGSESKPQGGSGEFRCVPINDCQGLPTNHNGDQLIENFIDIRTINIKNTPTSKCPESLTVCCTDVTIQKEMTQKTSTQMECGIRHSDEIDIRINGFQEGQAQYGEFPWMVALLAGGNNLFLGGGSLIHPQVVLTAAHKPHDYYEEKHSNMNNQLTVRVGEWDFESNYEPDRHQDIPVKQVIYHPRFFRGSVSNNLALLILEQPAKLGLAVRTICLPTNSNQKYDSQQCTFSGWGKDLFNKTGKYQKILKSVNVNMVEHSKCQKALRDKTDLSQTFVLNQSSVCAGDQGQDACTGDGGSPLVCPDPMSPRQYVQVGAVAWGKGCSTVGVPGVYSAVAPAVGWIQCILTAHNFDEKHCKGH